MKIVILSDTHGQHRRFSTPQCDLLIDCGDFMYTGRKECEIIDFNEWLGEQPATHRVLISGNHDILMERDSSQYKKLITNAIYLENSSVEIDGFKLYGSPVTPAFNGWAFNRERGEDIKRYWDAIPGDTDILITHGPPMGILDTISRWNDEHLGCADLLAAVRRVSPSIHCFGHIHGGRGTYCDPISRTHFLNAAVLNESYDPVWDPFVIEFDPLARP